MAVWSQKWFIVVPLVALILGHWSLLMHGEHHDSRWSPLVDSSIPRCVVEGSVDSRRMHDYLHKQQDSCRLLHLWNDL